MGIESLFEDLQTVLGICRFQQFDAVYERDAAIVWVNYTRLTDACNVQMKPSMFSDTDMNWQ
jgi:hypothetical protein